MCVRVCAVQLMSRGTCVCVFVHVSHTHAGSGEIAGKSIKKGFRAGG